MKSPVFAGMVALAPAWAAGAISLSQSSTQWTVIGGNYDYLSDQQTGIPAGDIVGDESRNPGFLTLFDNGGTLGDPTDGTLAFRVRLDDHDGNSNNPSFERKVWVGIDADTNGSIDVFVGVDRAGNANNVAVHSPGTDSNTSPSTTSVASTPYTSYDLATYTGYMDHRAVAESDYVGFDLLAGDMLDMNNGNLDYYVSFSLPFSDIVNFLSDATANAGNTMSINEDTPLQFILATATQDNALNQDLGGIPKNFDGTATWSSLGGMSPVMNAKGEVIGVPEPSAAVLGMVGAVLLVRRRRR